VRNQGIGFKGLAKKIPSGSMERTKREVDAWNKRASPLNGSENTVSYEETLRYQKEFAEGATDTGLER